MLNNFTYKQRNWLLLAAIIIFTVITYSLALSKTLGLAKECSALKKELVTTANAPEKIARLEEQLFELDRKAGLGSDSIDFQQALLEKVSTYSSQNNVTLKEFPSNHLFISKDLQIETNQFTLEGSFLSLLKCVFELEQVDKIGKVISTKYETIKDVRTKKVSLTAKIYVQNVKKISNSK